MIFVGPKVVHQVPQQSITAPPGSPSKPLVAFSSISGFVIPKQTFCSLPMTLLHGSYRILTHPICLSRASYKRNEFIFSFSIVLHQRTPFSPYLSVVTKLATLYKHLEETTQILSNDLSAPDTGQIFALCEVLLEDLNNYSEAMIPIDEANTLNIKLFPQYPPPPSLAPHQVPLAVVNLESLKDDNWDLTMLRILPFIDGVTSIRQIARKSDAEYKLVRKAIAHLVYHGCVMLIDIFSFGACFAPTEQIRAFVDDEEMQAEGRNYILTPEARLATHQAKSSSLESQSGIATGLASGQNQESLELARKTAMFLDGSGLVELYLSLRQGQPLNRWCHEHAEIITSGVLDVRRFVNFGVVKAFLYRVHRYAIAKSYMRSRGVTIDGDHEGMHSKRVAGSQKIPPHRDPGLGKYLDGLHCFDEIRTELGIGDKELTARLKEWGDVQIIYK